ncbi:hypothetical protein NC653_037134 [Populus alba x Populus x berolinensis]|uniref:Uncharacterized protein n=1 Tax=Populus alba x Populus x berolinensis TaxID=444605 RepID=A0AAD6LLS9_9ROSI|nr:hypothetical protein NC653_037134 [Populus alba x Populus x berolinensis]
MQTPSSFTPVMPFLKEPKIIQDRIRIEERVQLLRRWLVALKETDRERKFSSSPTYEHHADDSLKDSPKKPTIILEAPNEEEVSLLLEIFGREGSTQGSDEQQYKIWQQHSPPMRMKYWLNLGYEVSRPPGGFIDDLC